MYNTRNIFRKIIPGLLLLGILSSCIGREEPYAVQGETRLTLSFSTERPLTKSAAAETAVTSADVWLFVEGREEAVAALRGLDVSGGRAQAAIPTTATAAIITSGGTATVCVLTNLPAGFDPGTGVTRDALLSTQMRSSFAVDGSPSTIPMYGESTGTLSSGTVSASVSLRRIMSKVELHLTGITSPDGIWQPNPAGARVWLSGCTTAGSVAVPDRSRENRIKASRYPITDNGGWWAAAEPFYTYPSDWSDAQDLAMKIILSVPWSDDGGVTWRQCFYQMPVGDASMKVGSNEHLVNELSISILGSFEETEPTPLEPTLTVQQWGRTDQSADINDIRYLVVETNSGELNNDTHFETAFFSSHPVVIGTCTLKHKDLLSGTDAVIPASEYSAVIDGNLLVFDHDLDNEGGEGSDYSPYILEVTLMHSDNPFYSQTITVTQHPAISVEAKPNSGATVSNSKGYAYVNNGSGGSYGGNPSANGSTSNYNMYVINITKLENGSQYIIGDPRNREIDNLPTRSSWTGALSYTWSSNTYDLDGTRRRLSYYHPTEGGTRTLQMLSPQFRVASSYGACTKISYENAQRRCATYQEDGVPAGRWRVPTAAEIMYIIGLSQKGIIPALFSIDKNDTDGYWCAHGWVGGDSEGAPILHEGTSSGTEYVRCVYDEWYWGDYQISPRTNFRWGDKNEF